MTTIDRAGISEVNFIQASPGTEASRLSMQYVDAMYYEPVGPDGKPSLGALNKLLEKATIIWVRNGKEEKLTLQQMDGELIRGYYVGMKAIEVLSSEFNADDMRPIAQTKTIQIWNGESEKMPAGLDESSSEAGPYKINSEITVEVAKDEESNALYISQVIHRYTSVFIGNKESLKQEEPSKKRWLFGFFG